ncbi:MAG: CarD family transcriptional regulator, partial [Firmicutes bacterium]|nr:CarD family transcriptional regulator [Bacillota bacterium]
MFKVGDPVVYPMHGAGVIESIEDRQVLGETRAYYIIRISRGKMQVMVPVDGSEK